MQPDSKAIQVQPQPPELLKITPPSEPAWPQQPGCFFSGWGLPAPAGLCSQPCSHGSHRSHRSPCIQPRGCQEDILLSHIMGELGFLKSLLTCKMSPSSPEPWHPQTTCAVFSPPPSWACSTPHFPVVPSLRSRSAGGPGLFRNVRMADQGPGARPSLPESDPITHGCGFSHS